MSSEEPPQPICDTFNYANWNRTSYLSASAIAYRYLSKRINDAAYGVISFVSGLKTNLITVYNGSVLSIGSVGNTVSLFSPKLGSSSPANTSNDTSIISSAWVNSFWTYVRTQAYSWTGIQTFSGIKTDNIDASSSASTMVIGNILSAGLLKIGPFIGYFGGIEIGGGYTGGASVDMPTVNIKYLNTNNMSAVNVGDTMTVNNNSPSSDLFISPLDNRTGVVSLGAGSMCTANVGINNGVGSNGSVIIGTISSFLEVDCPSTFSALGTCTASYASIFGSDTSNTIITSNWLNTIWLVYLRTITNTWSAVQTFSALPLISASYSGIIGSNNSTTVITTNWINATWLPYLRGLANTWSLLQSFTAGISCTLPIRVTYNPSSLTVNTMIGYTYQANVIGITVSATRRCQCVLNGISGVGNVLPAGVYTVTYMAYLNTTTTGYLSGVVVRPAITNNVTSATGGVINLYGGVQSRSQSTTAPFYITGSTTLILDGTDCVAVGIESTITNTSNVDIYCQATRIA